MSIGVSLCVLLAALLHATWNVLLKGSKDRLWSITVLTIGASLTSLPLILFIKPPRPESYLYIALSVAIHVIYNFSLVFAYQKGDFGQVYPIARGLSPLLVSVGALLFAQEPMGWLNTLGIIMLSLGIISLAHMGRGSQKQAQLLSAALVTGLAIASYTLVDGIGSRVSNSPVGYAVWLFLLNAVPMVILYIGLRGSLRLALNSVALQALGGGVISFSAYGLVIWAATVAPIAAVSALRETSAIFALWVARIFLKEPLTRSRIVSCLLVTLGAAIIST